MARLSATTPHSRGLVAGFSLQSLTRTAAHFLPVIHISGSTHNNYLFKYSLVNTTGINELGQTTGALSLYPNPASSECTLKIDEPKQMSTAIICDAIGRQIMPLFNNQQLTTFNFSCTSLAPGLYFVKVTDNEGKVGVVKLVKE